MKVALLFLAVLGLANAGVYIPERQQIHSNHVHTRNLDDLLQQLIKMIPFADCIAVVENYLATDKDVQEAYAFLRSDTFKELTDKVTAMKEYQDALKYLSDAGLDIYTYQNIFRKLLGLPTIPPPTTNMMVVRESGLIRMINDILAVLPIAEIKQWFYSTCLPDPAFQEFLMKLRSQEFRDLVDNIHYSEEYRALTDVLRSQGIDVDAIEKAIADYISQHFVKGFSPRTLRTLVDELVAMLPTDELLNILITYVSTDPDVKKVMEFLQGDVFGGLVVNMEASAELNAFLAWVYSKGLDVYKYINMVLEILGQPPFVPPQRHLPKVPTVQSGLTDMINDMLKVIPVDQIVAWYHSTCEIDPEFQELMAKLRGPEFLKVVERFRADPAFSVMRDGLTRLGIDMVAVEAWLNRVFGWPIPTRNLSTRTLRTLVDEFVAMLPTDELLNILITYVSTDPDVKKVMEFLQGDVFGGLVVNMEASEELNAFLAWVYGKGLDVYKYINMVLEILGQPPFVPPQRHLSRVPTVQSGLTDMINDMLKVIPVDQIVAWYHSTCEIDPEFQELMAKLRGPEFLKVVERFRADPAFSVMRDGLTRLGIDMVAVEAWLNRVFGWPIPTRQFSTRTLRTLVDELVAMLPTDELLNILITYVSTDPDVKKVMEFLEGEVFGGLVVNMEASEELNAFLAWVYSKGLDVYKYINMVLQILGQPPFVPPQTRHFKVPSVQSGLTDMINDMLKVIPVDQIVAWYHSTCEIDPEFQELMAKLRGPEFLKVVERFRADPAFSVMRDGLTRLGIDMVAVEAWLNRVFGWPIPTRNLSTRTLRTLVDELVAMLPTDELLNILITYVSTDPDVKKVMEFLQGDVFGGLVVNMEASAELNAFLAWVYSKGLDVYKYINMVLEILGQPPFVPPKRHLPRVPTVQSGLTDMINDMLKVIPVDQIVAWYHSTCEIDPEFQELMAKLRGPEFLKVVERFRADPAFSVMRDGLTRLGIDMVAVEAWLNRVFGWPIPTRQLSSRTLRTLVDELVAMLPTDDLLNILITYVSTDPDVKKVMEFLQGDVFRGLVVNMEASEELNAFLAWVYSKELDVYKYINMVLEILGQPPFVPPQARHFKVPSVQSGLTDMINDMLNIIPVDQIVAWYHSTCEIDPEFQELMAKLRGPDFLKVVERFRADPAFNVMRDGLVRLGIDMVAVEAWLNRVFGW